MTHKIGQTGRFTLEGKTFELEREIHHHGSGYAVCRKDHPKGWRVPTYFLLQAIRNSPQRDEFNLRETYELVENPDNISRQNGPVAWFSANSGWAYLYCGRDPSYRGASLGVRYVRELPQVSSENSH